MAKNILLIFSLAFLSLGGLFLVLFLVDPYKAGFWGILLFFLSSFLFLFGLFSLLIIFFRKKILKKKDYLTFSCFRQSFLLSFFLLVLLFLWKEDVFNFWLGGLLFISLFLLEFFFSKK